MVRRPGRVDYVAAGVPAGLAAGLDPGPFEVRLTQGPWPNGPSASSLKDGFEEGTRYEENETVTGTIANDVATGSISGRVRIVKRNGKVVRCNFGPQRWTLVD